MSSKDKALAGCLFEAIDDHNLSNVIILLEKHGANPNIIIPKLDIAPIHYAVGFDNLEFAEKVTAIFLKKKADPNLYSEIVGSLLTPLHIACIWGRPTIVQLLLEHGGNLDLKCNEQQTSIQHAVRENHFQVIEVIQKFVFEQKIDKKKKELIHKSSHLEPHESAASPKTCTNEKFNTPIRNNHLKNALQHLDEKKFTPNRINYNFDVTSPYFVNITHRRHKTSRENSRTLEYDDDEETTTNDVTCNPQNLFELTEKNLKQFSQQMSQVIVINRLAIHKRRSYIKDWREKIQQIRRSNFQLDVNYINYLNGCNDVTLMNEIVKNESDESTIEDVKSSTDSFITAESNLQRVENAIGHIPEPPKYVERLKKDLEGKMFCEKKVPGRENLKAIHVIDHDDDDDDNDARTQSSVSTRVTLPPLNYDTDALRQEIKTLTGKNPGPITENTKHLYLKQMVKMRKKPETETNKDEQVSYSIELQRIVINYKHLEQNIDNYLKLETQMSHHFLERSHIKWREGNMKTSFIYLLIDPQLSDNLSLNYKGMDKGEVFARFLSSIFYVGKGKRSRPYDHLYDALKLYSKENNQVAERLENRRNQMLEKRVTSTSDGNKNAALGGDVKKTASKTNQNIFQESKKLNKIVDIWKAQLGVVCLHTFNNIMPVEAYTREAAIIEAIGMENLTNLKKGEYYGAVKNFSMRQKRELGVALLHRAMNIYLAEGESQLLPFDLI